MQPDLFLGNGDRRFEHGPDDRLQERRRCQGTLVRPEVVAGWEEELGIDDDALLLKVDFVPLELDLGKHLDQLLKLTVGITNLV